uniref:Uncharacterized protein n=1 Tax=Chrysemys picta bellii TaxID=8478 RepID=A0A8C3F9P0_CHRPI
MRLCNLPWGGGVKRGNKSSPVSAWCPNAWEELGHTPNSPRKSLQASAVTPLMMLLRMAPLLLLALARGVWGEREKPTFCGEVTECFTFDLICNSSDYEARLYPPSAWVSTRVNNTYTAAKTTGFWRLFRYIQGRNQLGVKIPMTAPVLTRVDRAAGETQEYTVSFLLPAARQ